MRIMRSTAFVAAMLWSVAAGDAQTVSVSTEAAASAWSETKWPFLIDQWGLGRAFQCRAADCGRDLMLYLRPKVGFCNCATGITQDEEIDRVGDMELVGRNVYAQGNGVPIAVGWMKGRSRPYLVTSPYEGPRFALAIVLSNKCDAVVATVVTDRAPKPEIERAALEFLGSETVLRWAGTVSGL